MVQMKLILIGVLFVVSQRFANSAKILKQEFLKNLKDYEIVTPNFVDEKSFLKKEVRDHDKMYTSQPKKLLIVLPIHSRSYTIELHLNTHLLSNGFEVSSLFKDGRRKVKKPSAENLRFCYYHGVVREISNSKVLVSTCNGIEGMIILPDETLMIEPLLTADDVDDVSVASEHVLFRPIDMINVPRGSCGHDGSYLSVVNRTLNQFSESMKLGERVRKRRHVDETLFVQLLVVADSNEVNEQQNETLSRVLQIVNIMDGYYIEFNIRTILIHLEQWIDFEPLNTTNSASILDSFEAYRIERRVNQSSPWLLSDHAALLYGGSLNERTVGLAVVGGMCSPRSSASLTLDYAPNALFPATVMTHEIGHNFGMLHDDDSCPCESSTQCIMDASISMTPAAFSWSNCSYNYLIVNFQFGTRSCLMDTPDPENIVFEGEPVCGNQIVEMGEDCDCGPPEHCDTSCCNSSTCLFQPGAVCSNGLCCNENCQIKEAGSECRTASGNECDLTEYCSGMSENCPENLYREDGTPCMENTETCYEGFCQTKDSQCKVLWGPNALSCADQHYSPNTRGVEFGNCGTSNDVEYIPCTTENQLCGKLFCYNGTAQPSSGDYFASVSFGGGTVCYVVSATLITDMVDPFLVRMGTECGSGNVCSEGTCMGITLNCDSTSCNDNGVCNNLGSCHCESSFAPPFCNVSGYGGSVNGGPNNINGISASFTSSSFDVYEGEEVQICVQLSALQGQLVAEFSMDIAVENGTAVHGGTSDFVVNSNNLNIIFFSGSINGDQSCVSISTINDNLAESEEYFSLSLTNFMNGNRGMLTTARVNIMESISDDSTTPITHQTTTTASTSAPNTPTNPSNPPITTSAPSAPNTATNPSSPPISTSSTSAPTTATNPSSPPISTSSPSAPNTATNPPSPPISTSSTSAPSTTTNPSSPPITNSSTPEGDLCNGVQCHSLAFCDTFNGTMTCRCYAGFEGNGTFCADVNECDSNTNDCPQDCLNEFGTFICRCFNGFTGDGYGCTELPPVNFTTTTRSPFTSPTTPESNFTTPFTNTTSSPPNNTGPFVPNIVCPSSNLQCSYRAAWLCEYIQWKIEFVGLFLPSFDRWRQWNLLTDGYNSKTYFPCTYISVTCRNPYEYDYFYGPNYCQIPYCRDGYYEDVSANNLQSWIQDQSRWRVIYNSYRQLLVSSGNRCRP